MNESQYNAWPQHGTGNGIDLQETNHGSTPTYTAPGAITIEGTYNHSTNQITVVASDVSFVSDVVYATHTIIDYNNTTGISTSTDF